MKTSDWRRSEAAGGKPQAEGERKADDHGGRADIEKKNAAIEDCHLVMDAWIIGQNPPGRLEPQRPQHILIDEPAGERLLECDIQGADAPMKGADSNSHEAVNDEQTFPGLWGYPGDMKDFMIGRARRQS